jgi:hypothetical protein
MRLCMERVLPPCCERTVKFSLPPIEAARTGISCGPSGVVDTFVRAIETTKKDNSRFNLLQILRAGDYDEDNSEDDSDGEDYEEAGEYEETDDRDS